MTSDELKDSIDGLRNVVLSLPTSLSEVFKSTFATLESPLKLQSFNLGPKNGLLAFSLSLGDVAKRSQLLTDAFGSLADTLHKLQIPKFFTEGLGNFSSRIRDVFAPVLAHGGTLAKGLANILTPVRASLVDGVKDIIKDFPSFDLSKITAKLQSIKFPDIATGLKDLFKSDAWTGFKEAVKEFKGMGTDFFTNAKKVFSGLPEKLSGLAQKGFQLAGGRLAQVGAGALKLASVAALPGAILSLTGMVENFRRSALAANSSNMRLASFNGQLFTEQMRFNLGQFMRTRQLAHATSQSGALLARRVNEMEDAFLPFDIMKQDIANKIGIIKANIATGFAKSFLTPLANAYNKLGNLRNKLLNSDSFGTRLATVTGTVGAGALTGALLGSRFGLPGTIAGAAIGGGVAALGLAPDDTSRIFGQALGWGTWGAVIGGGLGGLGGAIAGFFLGGPPGAWAGGVAGLKWGALGGGLAGAALGGGKAAWLDPKEADKIRQGPWHEFMRTTAKQGWLRPPLQIPPRPNRFQRVR